MPLVALEQVDVAAGEPHVNLRNCVDRAKLAFGLGADIVVFPELAVSGYVVDPEIIEVVAEPLEGPAVSAMNDVARQAGGLIAFGLAERSGDDVFNSVVVVGGEGPVLHYRKLHLFDQEKVAFTPGDLGLPVVETAFGNIGVCVCYDLRFVEVMRSMSLRGAHLVIAPAAWVGGFDKSVPATGATRHVESVLAQANLDQVAVVAVSQVANPSRGGPATLGGSVAVDAYGELIAGPLSRTRPDSALAQIDLAAVEAARVRSQLVRPREDRRTDVYAVSYGGERW